MCVVVVVVVVLEGGGGAVNLDLAMVNVTVLIHR